METPAGAAVLSGPGFVFWGLFGACGLVLDILAAGIVGLFTLAGWRHLRRVVS